MKVLNLGCAHSHVFEGWFGSDAEFLEQLSDGLLECPFCGDKTIQKLPSAPRLNLGGGRDQSQASLSTERSDPVSEGNEGAAATQQAELMRELRVMISKAEDVGDRFAEEARRIHQGEEPMRHIKGRASVADTVELLKEGIAVLPLPEFPGLKDPLH